jgi:multisubunit Na+/H+ antiporter MnhB subunit
MLRLAVLAVGAVLGWALLNAPAPATLLAPVVHARLAETGAQHPVTAVLLGFRAYDTLLEVAVLLLAVLAGGQSARLASATPRDAVLDALAKMLVPLMVLVAGYLLWAGAKQPGGAFQGAAVLAAAGVLLILAGGMPRIDLDGLRWRALLAAGLGVFILLFLSGTMERALLALEAVLTLSIAAALVSLFAAGRR